MCDNRSDFYLNLVPGFKNWDMCGSEAILSAKFGIVTDAKRGPIYYSSEGGHTLKGGIVAAKSARVY
jgi:3'-phosphoadenosine 5'-phosphosulfate (PAPS) 3'-phosphatase